MQVKLFNAEKVSKEFKLERTGKKDRERHKDTQKKHSWEGNTKAEQTERWEQETQILILANHWTLEENFIS